MVNEHDKCIERLELYLLANKRVPDDYLYFDGKSPLVQRGVINDALDLLLKEDKLINFELHIVESSHHEQNCRTLKSFISFKDRQSFNDCEACIVAFPRRHLKQLQICARRHEMEISDLYEITADRLTDPEAPYKIHKNGSVTAYGSTIPSADAHRLYKKLNEELEKFTLEPEEMQIAKVCEIHGPRRYVNVVRTKTAHFTVGCKEFSMETAIRFVTDYRKFVEKQKRLPPGSLIQIRRPNDPDFNELPVLCVISNATGFTWVVYETGAYRIHLVLHTSETHKDGIPVSSILNPREEINIIRRGPTT